MNLGRHFYIFPTQIVVMKQLDPELHFWLSNLRKDIPEPTFRDVIIRMHGFTTKQEKEYAKAYFGALAEYNKQIHAKAKEEPTMNEYMREFYKDEIEASALAATIDNIRKMMKNLNLSREAAMKALDIKETDFPKYMAML